MRCGRWPEANGNFHKDNEGKVTYQLADESLQFKIVMHSIRGLLPAVRFHLEDSHLNNKSLLNAAEIAAHMRSNDGFLSLDFIFEKDFKEILRNKEPEFFERIRNMNIEAFVASMMELREKIDAFTLLKAEYEEARKSIKRHESVYWKELLAVLSFAMNYPAKHLSAEDMLRLQKTLQPLISIVIAFVPQSSCEELMALHEAGVLDIISVNAESNVEPHYQAGIHYHYTEEDNRNRSVYYQTFVNCVGQPHLSYEDFPFKSLIETKTISRALLKFRSKEEGKKIFEENASLIEQISGDYYLKVSGITINDNFQIIDPYGVHSNRIYIMAVPYIGGYNPDYSGLDFCEEASRRIISSFE